MIGKEMRFYFIDMLKALHYCHVVAKVVHRDIKPDNIMLNHNDEAVLIDFGVSEIVDN
jgi:serine/threonine protein kinase